LKAKLIDANVIIRFLLNDIPEQADIASKVIYGGAYTNEVILAEVVYVLVGVYKIERKQVSSLLLSLLEFIHVENLEVMTNSLKLFAEYKLDFVDCLIISYHNILKVDVFSFDKKLLNKLK